MCVVERFFSHISWFRAWYCGADSSKLAGVCWDKSATPEPYITYRLSSATQFRQMGWLNSAI